MVGTCICWGFVVMFQVLKSVMWDLLCLARNILLHIIYILFYIYLCDLGEFLR